MDTVQNTNSHIFTNKDGNTLMKEFEGVLQHNPQIRNLDAVVGFLRASGYFSLRPFLDNINKVRVLIGIDVDKYIADAARQGRLFFGAEEEVKVDFFDVPISDVHQILMCTDGLTNMLSDEEISDILLSDNKVKQKAELLVTTANEKGGRDNITVVVIDSFTDEV